MITSSNNETIKFIRKLSNSSKFRQLEGLALADGIHLVGSFFSSKLKAHSIVCAQSALGNSEVKSLLNKAKDLDIPLTMVTDSLYESFSKVQARVGISILFYPVRLGGESLQSLGQQKRGALLLEDIQDPGNLGTILRTSVATGMHDILLSSASASAWSPKTLRAGMGAQFSLNIYENVDLVKAIKLTKCKVIATSLSKNSQSLFRMNLQDDVWWVFGNEGKGVGAELLSLATYKIEIPQAQSTIESLNVSSAVAVCLYEQFRQQHHL